MSTGGSNSVVKLRQQVAPVVLVTRWGDTEGVTSMQPEYTPALLERFWSKVDRNGPVPDYAPHLGPCWIWTACLTRGYGQFSSGHGRRRRAHRLSYEVVRGAIPDGLVLDHLCRVLACVRPDHLEPVTQQVNVMRALGVDICYRGHSSWRVSSGGNRSCRECRKISRRLYKRNRRDRERGIDG